MKQKELAGFLIIAIVMVLLSLFFFNYSFFIGHTASFSTHLELQHLYASNHSAESLTLSNDKVKDLLQWAVQDEKRWRHQIMYSIKILFYSAIVLLLLGSTQMVLSFYVYKRNSALLPKPGDSK